MIASPEEVIQAKCELARRATYHSFEAFFRLFPPRPDYIYGTHTIETLRHLHDAIIDVEEGRNRYLIISIPPRHGKSDISSRRLPAWALLRNPEWEIILCSYNHQLASEVSLEARRCYRERVGPLFQRRLSVERNQIASWKLEEGGALFAAGIGGTVTGRGADLLIIDDYLKSREEAESEVVRNRIWESFRSDLMTRIAPVHGVVIVANRWHEDDLVGRIKNRNDPEHADYDPDYPVFEEVIFPAQDEAEENWLFPERFSAEWYKVERAFMGTYAWNAQGLQNPQPRHGNLFQANMARIVDKLPEGLRFVRGWDLASTKKERIKDDPDFTVGTKAAYGVDGILYVADVKRGQWEATKRDKIMIATAEEDGPGVMVDIECVAGYKDTYTRAREQLLGHATVRKCTPKGDKVSRASFLEPKFEAGQVVLLRGDWNAAWKKEFLSFPGGSHDDQVDSLVVATHKQSRHEMSMGLSR